MSVNSTILTPSNADKNDESSENEI